MTPELNEEQMRRALFGDVEPVPKAAAMPKSEPVADFAFTEPTAPDARKKAAKAFTPRLKVTLLVGNEYEGQMYETIHEANTLSTLLAEQEAVKVARKKYRYIEVVSIKSM
ncbi:hypothetical protein [Pseudomonas baltica]|uniref:hypothetical protein n=1 Tax=Pseudomonas baltica TaxID=2762576 RepID=UPI0028A1FA2F|nr:hypothetical protein [Pseudomonas baltica]